MVNRGTSWYLTLIALVLLGGAILVVQPYSADWPGTGYTAPARRYIHAALHRDSLLLSRLSASERPVHWALAVSRGERDTLALWDRRVQAFTGKRSGDTAEVFVYPPGEVCATSPIVFRFVGVDRHARVLEARSACLARR